MRLLRVRPLRVGSIFRRGVERLGGSRFVRCAARAAADLKCPPRWAAGFRGHCDFPGNAGETVGVRPEAAAQ